MTETEHDALRELAASYALGALERDERERFEAHVTSCAACAEEVRSLSAAALALPLALPQVAPPPDVRDRVLAATAGTARIASPPSSWLARSGWLTAAAALILAVALGAYTTSLQRRVRDLETTIGQMGGRVGQLELRVASSVRSAEAAQMRLAVLTAPDVTDVRLAGQPPAPGANGRAFWSRSRGLVFAASALPPLPAGRTYQLWYLTSGAPVSAGLVKPDDGGRVSATFETPAAVTEPSGFALSIEPEGGVPAPTGAIYLAGLRRQS